MQNSSESLEIKESLNWYHDYVTGMIRGSKQLLERFIWNWPSKNDQGRPQPSLHSCFYAIDRALETCSERGKTIRTKFNAAISFLRTTKNASAPAWFGIGKSTFAEIGEAFGLAIGELLAITQPPFCLDDAEEIDRDHERAKREESFSRMHSKDRSALNDPDRNPANSIRASSEWFEFQERFATEFGQRFLVLLSLDLDLLESEVQVEYAKAVWSPTPQQHAIANDAGDDSNESYASAFDDSTTAIIQDADGQPSPPRGGQSDAGVGEATNWKFEGFGTKSRKLLDYLWENGGVPEIDLSETKKYLGGYAAGSKRGDKSFRTLVRRINNDLIEANKGFEIEVDSKRNTIRLRATK